MAPVERAGGKEIVDGVEEGQSKSTGSTLL